MSGDVRAGDEPSTLELQMRLDDIERSEGRDSTRWLALAAALLTGVALAPGSAALAAAVLVAATLVATAMGFFQVRRRQRRESIESELEERRAEALEGAGSRAVRLVALRDELDRRESEPSGVGVIVLLALAAVLLVPLGLFEGIAWVSSAGVFAGLVGVLRFGREATRRRDRRDLEEEIHELEARPWPPTGAIGTSSDDPV